ncbi:YihY/virulence factor BrkB family protein [Halospeciosus flavus]|uniref:YihY/virulence factor BrkB family protein n=1 Tax=Halospeciosus flavus TaxID=3032283 RepID=A0ABD5Z7Y1_9EURY|nr:YihY/virulence factor BrkB family protein [Halospeciosus flavus]
MSRLAAATGLVRAVAADAKDNRITFLAAAVAYYAFVSFIPLLLLVVAVGSYVGAGFADAVANATAGVLAESGQRLLENALQNPDGRQGATVVSVALLLWSGLKLFRGLDTAFSTVYGVTEVEGILDQLRDALVVLVSIAVAAGAAVAVGILVPVLDVVPYAGVVGVVVLVVMLFVVFLPMFYVFPDAELELAEVWPGTLFAAVGWTVLTHAFRLYAGYADEYEIYGLLGAVILFVTWLYVSGIVIMLGAELNAVLAGRTEDEADADVEVERPESAPDVTEMAKELREVRERLDRKTVSRDDLEADLHEYVEQRVRRNHARGWGPYLVLLYGTAMTLGAFYLLSGGWAILAMVVIWLSTLGLYTLMVLVGAGFSAADVPGKAMSWFRSKR